MKQHPLIIHRPVQYVQNFDRVRTDPIKNQIIAVDPPPYASVFPIGQQWVGARHSAQSLAAVVQFRDEGFRASQAVFSDLAADLEEVGVCGVGDDDLHSSPLTTESCKSARSRSK